jgi:subtilase family serine protease
MSILPRMTDWKPTAMSFDHEDFMLYAAKLTRTLTLGVLILFFAAAPSRAENFAMLVGNHPDAAADLAAEGSAPAYRSLQMEIYLNPRNQAQLDQLLQDQQDPSSPQYEKWLTPTEYDQQFGPTDADVAQLTQWLTSEGFTVTHASAHERRVAFSGNVATTQTAFLVHIAGSRDEKSFGNVDDPQVPESLAPKINYLAGLDNLHGTIWNTLIPDPPYINDSGYDPPVPLFGPTDTRTFNNEEPLLTATPTNWDGTGQCIAVSEGSDVDQASLSQFNTVFGLPPFVPGTNYFSVFPDGLLDPPGSGGGGQPYGEAMLDVEYAHGIAPGASIVIYAANAGTSEPDPAEALVDSAIAATSDPVHHCYSVAISWAQCGEPTSFYKNLETNAFKPGAAEGQSIFVATGDVGTAAPALGSCVVPPRNGKPYIEENAGSDWVTAVGASMFTATYDSDGNDTSTAANTKQSVWNYRRKAPQSLSILAAEGASGGGYSKIFPKPAWQNGVAGIAGKFRAVPDLVLGGGSLGGTATLTIKKGIIVVTGSISPAPDFWECFDQGLIDGNGAVDGPEWSTAGGTSIVPPQYAAILAIINQKAGAPSGQGLINKKLYAMAQANLKNLTKVGIYDIETGNNAYAPVAGYAAKKGYDLASGWGAIDFTNFVNSFIAFPSLP